MAKAIGIGGVFLKAKDPKALKAWYQKHLGIELAPDFDGATIPDREGQVTVWAFFNQETDYFGAGQQSAMVNYIVDDIEALLAQLRTDGVDVDTKTSNDQYGKFGWATDPEGNRFELWQPPKS